MSKNLTRKGLALGAIVALGTSLFAGAPAFAGVESTGLTLAPNAGTTYNSIAGSSFDLSTVVNSNIETTTVKAAKLSYLITNSAAASVKVGFKTASADVTDYAHHAVRVGATAATVGASSVDAVETSNSLTSKAIVVTGNGTNVGYNSASVASNHLFVTSSSDATENVVVTVQAFIDENSNGLIDDFDLTSPVRTLTFVPAANVTATTTVASASVGSSTITGKVVLGNDINMANLGTDVKIGFKKNNVNLLVSVPAAGGTTDVTDVSWDSTEAGLINFVKTVVNTSDVADVVSAGTIVAQAYYKTSATKLGAASNASTISNGYSNTVDSTDAIEVVATSNVLAVTSGALANAVKVRAGYAGDIKFSSGVSYLSTDNVTELAAGAGVTVRVTLTRTTLDSASTFSAGGKTLTATSAAQTFTTTTDADGAIAFTASGTGKTGDVVVIKVEALKANGTYDTDSSNTTVTYETAAATTLVNTDLSGSGAVVKTTKGGSYTLNYVVLDQFLQPWVSTSTYQVKLAPSAGASFLYFAPVSAGKASQVIVDNSTAVGNYSITATLEKLNTVSNTWTQSVLTAAAVNIYVNAVVPATLTAVAKSTVAVATITKTLVTADLRADNSTNSSVLIGYGTAKQAISGVVTDATGAAVAGAPVTVTGAGLAFVVNGLVYSVGTATVNADANGAYSVDVYSNTAGKPSVVVTSGAATKTVAIEFSGVTTTANTNVVTIDVPTSVQVGRAVTITVKIVDKFGNPVVGLAPTLTLTGVGSLSSTAPAATDKTGVTTVQFVAGANDFGDATITAKYTGKDAAGADAVVSVVKTVTVGITDAQVDIVGKRITAVASFSKGKTVALYVDGVKVWSKISVSDSDVLISRNLKKGTHSVTVKISGGFITTEKFIVK